MVRENGRNDQVNWQLCPISALLPGARTVGASGAAAIAGLVGAMHEAKRVRDMRKYPFWACAVRIILELCVLPRPERYCAIARPEGTRP